MIDQTEPTITAEQVAAYQRQQAAQEQAALQACADELTALLQRHRFAIVAWPQFTQDGRTVAQWGLRRA